jgi:hypothetical protein
MRGSSMILSWGMLENWQPGMTTNDIRATGVIGWIGWLQRSVERSSDGL